ncbi:MAG: mannose-1-phosphate guanylyltransferase [Bacteroidales bacterium]|jgi:mannose-1-phosphate guanylyltransferase
MNKNYYAIIMAGGVGARFWPMSRSKNPKQFLDILGTGESLIQQTFNRLNKICDEANILVVTGEEYKDQVLEHLPKIREDNVLCEPLRRNTAPCIAYANYKILKENPNAQIIVAPSDHIITKEDVFLDVVNYSMEQAAKNNCLITLGIKPFRPDTGYGYIQVTDDSLDNGENKIFKVKTFTEKPNLETAIEFLKSGEFVWNSGIFIWSLMSIQKAFNKYLPEVNDLFAAGIDVYGTQDEKEFIEKTYYMCPNISIDYGIMEKATNVFVYPTDFGWSDLGTWVSLFENSKKDDNNNAVLASKFLGYDTENSIISSKKGKLIVTQGLSDYIVVDEDDVLLICKKDCEQQIKEILEIVKSTYGEEFI